MKAFSYTARTDTGTRVEGVTEADTREEALTTLREGGLIVESINDQTLRRDFNLSIGSKQAREKAISIMCNQFAIILQAGIPIVRALELVGDQTEDKRLKNILGNVAGDVSAGYNLADSFAKHSSTLPTTFVESVRAGEASGNLSTAFRRLSKYFAASSRTRTRINSALIYPVFVLVIAIIVVGIIMMFAVPTFASTFESMGTDMPLITRALIGVSTFLSQFWWLLALLCIAAAILVRLMYLNEGLHARWSKAGLTAPVFGRISRMNAAAQYASTMSMMLNAGLSVVNSVEITARSLSNYYLSQRLMSILPDLESGKQLAECLGGLGDFPELVNEMTGIGEQTGSLENTLNVMAEYYENEVETATQRALSVLEPAMVVVLALVVLSILLAIYLPMFDIYGGFNSNL